MQNELAEVLENAPTPETEASLFDKAPKTTYTQYEAHDPLYLDDNSNFNLTAAAENWLGDGTKINPYWIIGLNITSPSDSLLIEIKNTNVHFRISYCQLAGRNTGICLFNAMNGQLTENAITDNSYRGISVVNSVNSTLTGNTVSNNFLGISLEDSGGEYSNQQQLERDITYVLF